MAISNYYLGCPIWSNRAWIGELFRPDASASDFLTQYATVFNTVEGNTTFYAVPPAKNVLRWRDQSPPTFRFSFKLPRSITHDRRLRGAEQETLAFLDRMAPLGERLGPFLVQLPPGLGPDDWPTLSTFLTWLPHDHHYAVEVRHPGFFGANPAQTRLDDLLRDLGMDRVIFDSRPLRHAAPDDPATRQAQQRKPNLPVHPFALGPHPMLRYIAHPTPGANDAWLAEWAHTVAAWIAEGKRPYVFIHAPDDFYAPRLARRFHQRLGELHDVGSMPSWPAEHGPHTAHQLPLL